MGHALSLTYEMAQYTYLYHENVMEWAFAINIIMQV